MSGEAVGEMNIFLHYGLDETNQKNPDIFLLCRNIVNYPKDVLRSAGND